MYVCNFVCVCVEGGGGGEGTANFRKKSNKRPFRKLNVYVHIYVHQVLKQECKFVSYDILKIIHIKLALLVYSHDSTVPDIHVQIILAPVDGITTCSVLCVRNFVYRNFYIA